MSRPPQQRRTLTTALALSFAVLALSARAWAGTAVGPVQLRGLDVSGYPNVRFAVVTATPSSTAPVVREGGQLVAGVTASNLASDANVVLAIDRSRSMAGASLAAASDAADGFVVDKPASDRIGIVAFGRTAAALTSGFSTSTIDAEGALRSIAVDSVDGTALYDAVVLSAQELARQSSGGRVIVLLTDGQDVSSKASLDDAIRAARAAGAEVYPIAIEGPGYTPAPLRRLAAATGGEFVTAASGDLRDVYASIADKLSRTWQIQYATAARPGDRVRLEASVPGEGSSSVQLAVPASVGAPPAVAPPSLLPAHVYRNPVVTYVVAFAFAVLLALALLALGSAKKASWVRSRLEPHLAAGRRRGRRRRRGATGASVAVVLRATERVFGDLRQWRALRRLLERADVPLRPAEFAWIAFGGGCLGAVVVGIATGSGPAALFGFALGAIVPWTALWAKAKRRLAAFENQLPDLLITLAASLKAGHSFRQGIQTVVDEGQPPAAAEFRRVLTDAQLGRPLEDALLEMAERVGSKNFDFVITAVTIQRQVGGSLAGLFDMVADTVRQRQQFARRIRSLTAMGRMSAYVLVGLPFFLAGAMTLLNRDYMKPLFDTSTGHVMIVLALGMMAVGSLILKKIVSFRG